MLNGDGKLIESGSLTAVVTLDDVLRDPASALRLPRDVLVALMSQCGAVEGTLRAALAIAVAPAPAVQPQDRMLTVDEAAERLRRSRDWIYRNASTLPFVRRISRKSLLISENGMQGWLDRRRRN